MPHHPPHQLERQIALIGLRRGEGAVEQGSDRGFRLTFIDFGMMAEIPASLRDGLRMLLIAVAGRDSRGLVAAAQEMGYTLLVTSLGPLGGIATTPVINRPEVAIIGPNKIVERPVFDGDDIRRAKLMNLSISCDHRVVDGWDAASYVQALKKLIETPVLLFAD